MYIKPADERVSRSEKPEASSRKSVGIILSIQDGKIKSEELIASHQSETEGLASGGSCDVCLPHYLID